MLLRYLLPWHVGRLPGRRVGDHVALVVEDGGPASGRRLHVLPVLVEDAPPQARRRGGLPQPVDLLPHPLVVALAAAARAHANGSSRCVQFQGTPPWALVRSSENGRSVRFRRSSSVLRALSRDAFELQSP